MRARLVLVGILVACAIGLETLTPAMAQVHIGVHIGTPPPPPQIVVTAPPQLVVVPRTPVFYAPAVPYNYFFHRGKYYVFHEGAWFYAPVSQGPWTYIAVEKVPKPILRVPAAYYKVPPGHRKEKGPHPKQGHGKGHKHKKHKDDD